jgi:PAS domain S-box-containing protein
MEQAPPNLVRPVDFERWPKGAQLAYDALMGRTLRAETSLAQIQHQLHATPSQVANPSDTLTWQTLMVRTMSEVLQETATTLDPTHMLDTVTRTVGHLLEATSVYVCDWNTLAKTCTVLSQYISEKGNANEKMGEIGEVYQLDPFFENKLLHHPHWVAHQDDDDLSTVEKREFERHAVFTMLYVPMMANDELIGFLEVWDSAKKRDFHPRQLDFVISVVSQIAGSVRMAQLHRAVKESEARFRLLMNTMSGGLVQVDRNGMIQFTNERFAEMIEKKQSALIGEHLDSVWVQAAESTDIAGEARVPRSNGEILWLQISRSQITSDNGQALGAVYIYTDISKRKEAEQQAIELGVEKQRVNLLSQFVQNASHEFYTPLSVMNTQLYLLAKRLPGDVPVAMDDSLQTLREQTGTIHELVQALVMMTKLDSIRSLSMRSYKLNALVTQTVDDMRTQIEAKKQHLHVEMSNKPVLVLCDAEKLRLALKEVVDNAHRYTPEGGNIVIRLFRREEQAVVEVRDTGIGMSPEVQEQVFVRFYREDEARTSRGFGLGLSIAKRIMDLHYGQITVHSAPKLGSTFRIIMTAVNED